jgi:hypothetical protein
MVFSSDALFLVVLSGPLMQGRTTGMHGSVVTQFASTSLLPVAVEHEPGCRALALPHSFLRAAELSGVAAEPKFGTSRYGILGGCPWMLC